MKKLLLIFAAAMLFAGCNSGAKKYTVPSADEVIDSMGFKENGKYEQKFKTNVQTEYRKFTDLVNRTERNYKLDLEDVDSSEEKKEVKEEYKKTVRAMEDDYLNKIDALKREYDSAKANSLKASGSFDESVDALKDVLGSSGNLLKNYGDVLNSLSKGDISKTLDSTIKAYGSALDTLEKSSSESLSKSAEDVKQAMDLLNSDECKKLINSYADLLKSLGNLGTSAN